MPGIVPAMRKTALIFALLLGSLAAPAPVISTAAFAQAPPPVPAEPDTERRTRYTGVSSVTTFPVGFDIYGDGTDFQNWLEVYVNGINVQPTGNWNLVPTAGSFTTLSRPLLAANLNVVFTAAQSGTIDIVGARRPRRTSQLSNNAGVTARDFNQIVTDLWMTMRETWDRTNDLTGRAILGVPGDNFGPLPPPTARIGQYLCFAAGTGAPTMCAGAQGSGTIAAGTGITFTASNPTTISANITSGPGIVVAPSAGSVKVSTSLGVLTNTLSTQTLPFTITTGNTPCGSTVNVAGGPGTLTLSGVAGFDTACVIQVCNTAANSNTTHAIKLSGFPRPSMAHLWMGQCEEVSIVNGAWFVTKFPGRFVPAFVMTCFVDTGGDNSNDGLVSNVSNAAVKDPQQCILIWQIEVDLFGSQPTIMLTNGQINPQTGGAGPLTLVGGVPKVIFVQGNGGNATLQNGNAGGNVVAQVQDFGGYFIFVNITLDCSSAGTHPCFSLFMHQQGGVDFNANVVIKGGASNDTGVISDSVAKINGNSLVTIAGTMANAFEGDLLTAFKFSQGIATQAGTTVVNNMFLMTGGSKLNYSGPMTAVATTAVNTMFAGRDGSSFCLAMGTTTGTFVGLTQWSILGNSVLTNQTTTAVPGSAGTNTAAGFAPGIIGAGTSGGC